MCVKYSDHCLQQSYYYYYDLYLFTINIHGLYLTGSTCASTTMVRPMVTHVNKLDLKVYEGSHSPLCIHHVNRCRHMALEFQSMLP